jgi:proteic killer suppression protein
MIERFRHEGLERFFRNGDLRGINARHADWLRVLLAALNTATGPDQVGQLPGARLHSLSGDRKGQWAVSVSGNWRLVFTFDGDDATNVDLVDYH